MRYGIMYVLGAAMLVVAARPASAADQGSTSTDIRPAVAAGETLGNDGVPVQEVQYRRGNTKRGTYVRPRFRRYYRGPGNRYPFRSFDRSPYYRYPNRYQSWYPRPYSRDGFFLRTPRFRFGIGW